ncbi:MAG: EAL domain-containing protein [Comamonadaceae bacterium]|nr:EAL domain-containing protein [Comamonadaceae bacterium]
MQAAVGARCCCWRTRCGGRSSAASCALHYQPQVDGAGGHIVGAEALLRWQHAERGAVSPRRSSSRVAESSGLIVHDRRVGAARRPCAPAAATGAATGLAPMTLAVNLSARAVPRTPTSPTACRRIAGRGRRGPPGGSSSSSPRALRHGRRRAPPCAAMNELHGAGRAAVASTTSAPATRR